MIPKQIFFIWLGDERPAYVDFSAKTFSEVNPAFKVDVLHWNVAEVENPKDRLLRNAVAYTREHWNLEKPFIQELADVYRYTFLGEYGGIYLDADTFPIRPFPDVLLECPFVVTRSYDNNWWLFREIFFMGYEKGPAAENVQLLAPHNSPRTEEFRDLRKKFFDCRLKYGEHFGDPKTNFINHYNDYRWNKDACRVQLCSYDNTSHFFSKYVKRI